MSVLIAGFFAPTLVAFGSLIWLGYMLFTFDGKPAAKRLAVFVLPAALLVVSLVLIVSSLIRP